jgi:two-component system alkaline phosphatase synthesis response regulator PhoP
MATILVIDDDLQIQAIIGNTLKQQGYTVLAAGNGNDGLSIAKKDKPDLILLDMMLPGDGGLQFLKKLRETPAIAVTKVMVMTNLESDNVIERANALGVSDYLVKADMSLENVSRIIKQKLAS